MKISLEKLYQRAAERPLGYIEEVISCGTIDGAWLRLESEKWKQLRDKYSPDSVARKSSIENPKLSGLGDIVALALKPVVKVSDKLLGTRLEGCKPCARRQARLNALLPFKKGQDQPAETPKNP